jgi:transposase InsO family protein
LSDYAQLPWELQHEVNALVKQTKIRSDWSIRQTLRALEISPATYYRWHRAMANGKPRARPSAGSMYELLDSEREAIIDYALKHAEVRHRELAWRMLDEGIVAVSASSVYRVLREANLVCGWKPKPKVKGSGREKPPTQPDEKWQTDIKYVRVGGRNYYLLSFMDVYSRYIVHHELLTWMDGQSVSVEAAAAIATLPADVRPDIQSDHGSGFISREFRIRRQTMRRLNGIIERSVSRSTKPNWATSPRPGLSSPASSTRTTMSGCIRPWRTCGRWTIIEETRRRFWPSVAGSYRRPGSCESRRTSSCDSVYSPSWRTEPCLIRRRRLSHFD